ncbi:MAG: oligopeptide/dipeptide ABC transporter ATP-binding protein, partial [Halarsenatibacteraceae bacterium]
ALIGAIPEADPIITKSKERFQLKEGNIPELKNIPSGCAFNTRCPWAEDPICYNKAPLLIGSGEHQVACHVVNND